MSQTIKSVVRLEHEEREQLRQIVDRELYSKSVHQRVRNLLQADEAQEASGWNDQRVPEFAEVSLSTMHRVRQWFVEEGFEAAVSRKPSPNRQYL